MMSEQGDVFISGTREPVSFSGGLGEITADQTPLCQRIITQNSN